MLFGQCAVLTCSEAIVLREGLIQTHSFIRKKLIQYSNSITCDFIRTMNVYLYSASRT